MRSANRLYSSMARPRSGGATKFSARHSLAMRSALPNASRAWFNSTGTGFFSTDFELSVPGLGSEEYDRTRPGTESPKSVEKKPVPVWAQSVENAPVPMTYTGTPARSSRNPQYTTSAPAPPMAHSENAKASPATAAAPLVRVTRRPSGRRIMKPATEHSAYGTSVLSVDNSRMNVNTATRPCDALSATSTVVSAVEIRMPTAGLPRADVRAKIRGNTPSSAAARGSSAATSVQPLSAPR